MDNARKTELKQIADEMIAVLGDDYCYETEPADLDVLINHYDKTLSRMEIAMIVGRLSECGVV